MQPTHQSKKSPVRRIILASAFLFFALAAAAIIYDTPPPNDADFQVENPGVADTDNGLLLLEGITVGFKNRPADERNRIRELCHPGSTTWDASLAEKIISDDQLALDTLSKALAKPTWFHQPTTNNHFPTISTLSPLATLKKIAAIHCFETGEPQKGITHLRELHLYADSIGLANLSLIGELIHIAVESTAAQTVARITPALTDRNTLTGIQDLIIKHPPDRTTWQQSARAEFTFLKNSFREFGRRGYGSPLIGKKPLESLTFKPNLTLQKLLDACRESSSNALAKTYASRTTTLIDQLSLQPQGWTSYLNLNHSGDSITTEFIHPIRDTESRTWLTHIYHTRSLLLVALQRYQLDHQNQLPHTLADLVPTYLPEIPQDPYNGTPLRYNPKRRLVWSVGQNLTDDGGHHDPEASRIDADNPTIHIPLPATP